MVTVLRSRTVGPVVVQQASQELLSAKRRRPAAPDTHTRTHTALLLLYHVGVRCSPCVGLTHRG